MISWLKKHFIPHTGNDHKPHFLRSVNILNIVYLVLVIEFFVFLVPTITKINIRGGMAAVLPAVLANLTNEAREESNLDVLSINSKLTKAAELKAQDMASLGYFAHTSPEGKTPWYWLDQVGYDYQYAGENLAINFIDSRDVTDAWMNSPTHKANIVKSKYTEVGTGIATGMYEGKETIFVAQVYANPNKAPVIIPQEPKKDIAKANPAEVVLEPTQPQGISQENILGAESVIPSVDTVNDTNITSKNPSFLQSLIASPRNTSSSLLYVIFAIILASLILYIVIKMKNHHGGLITNGLLALMLIGAIYIANYYISFDKQTVTQSLDYTHQS